MCFIYICSMLSGTEFGAFHLYMLSRGRIPDVFYFMLPRGRIQHKPRYRVYCPLPFYYSVGGMISLSGTEYGVFHLYMLSRGRILDVFYLYMFNVAQRQDPMQIQVQGLLSPPSLSFCGRNDIRYRVRRVYLTTYPSICLFIKPSIYPSYISLGCLHYAQWYTMRNLSTYPSIYLCMYRSIYQSVYLTIHPFTYPYIYHIYHIYLSISRLYA